MAKYSQKLKVVQDYLRGGDGYGYLEGKYGIADKWQVKKWIKTYEEYTLFTSVHFSLASIRFVLSFNTSRIKQELIIIHC